MIFRCFANIPICFQYNQRQLMNVLNLHHRRVWHRAKAYFKMKVHKYISWVIKVNQEEPVTMSIPYIVFSENSHSFSKCFGNLIHFDVVKCLASSSRYVTYDWVVDALIVLDALIYGHQQYSQQRVWASIWTQKISSRGKQSG